MSSPPVATESSPSKKRKRDEPKTKFAEYAKRSRQRHWTALADLLQILLSMLQTPTFSLYGGNETEVERLVKLYRMRDSVSALRSRITFIATLREGLLAKLNDLIDHR